MRAYETVFILTPVLTADQVERAVSRYVKLLAKHSVEIVHQESLGLKKMSYPIQKKTLGHYYLIEFNAPGTFLETLDTVYQRDEEVLRHLIIHLNKHAEAYNKKRRVTLQEAAEKATQESAQEAANSAEPTVDTEKSVEEPAE